MTPLLAIIGADNLSDFYLQFGVEDPSLLDPVDGSQGNFAVDASFTCSLARAAGWFGKLWTKDMTTHPAESTGLLVESEILHESWLHRSFLQNNLFAMGHVTGRMD